jgi:hypothetical protein
MLWPTSTWHPLNQGMYIRWRNPPFSFFFFFLVMLLLADQLLCPPKSNTRLTRPFSLRILHVPTFWVEYQKFWENPNDESVTLRLNVSLVIGIGSSLYDHGDRAAALRNISLVQQWIYSAQTWFPGLWKRTTCISPGYKSTVRLSWPGRSSQSVEM